MRGRFRKRKFLVSAERMFFQCCSRTGSRRRETTAGAGRRISHNAELTHPNARYQSRASSAGNKISSSLSLSLLLNLIPDSSLSMLKLESEFLLSVRYPGRSSPPALFSE